MRRQKKKKKNPNQWTAPSWPAMFSSYNLRCCTTLGAHSLTHSAVREQLVMSLETVNMAHCDPPLVCPCVASVPKLEAQLWWDDTPQKTDPCPGVHRSPNTRAPEPWQCGRLSRTPRRTSGAGAAQARAAEGAGFLRGGLAPCHPEPFSVWWRPPRSRRHRSGKHAGTLLGPESVSTAT